MFLGTSGDALRAGQHHQILFFSVYSVSTLVLYEHAFQFVKWCILYKIFYMKIALKIILIHFLRKIR